MTPQNLYLFELNILNMIFDIYNMINLTHLSLNFLTQIEHYNDYMIFRSTASPRFQA